VVSHNVLAKDGSQQQQESPSTSYNKAKMLQKQAHIARPGDEKEETMAGTTSLR
jgi:hypothetical protein